MEDTITNQPKVYTDGQISLSTFIGGPLASGILLSRNFKVFGDDEAARNSLYLGVLGTVILISVFYFAPYSFLNNIPTQLIPLINTAVVYLVFYLFQKEKFKNIIIEGGRKESYPKAIGIGLLSFLIFTLLSIVVVLDKSPYDGEVKTFGRINNAIYYDEGIAETDISIIGQTLVYFGFFNDEFQQVIQIRKEGSDIYHIYLEVDKIIWDNTEINEDLKQLAVILQNSLYKKNILISFYYDGFLGIETKRIN